MKKGRASKINHIRVDRNTFPRRNPGFCAAGKEGQADIEEHPCSSPSCPGHLYAARYRARCGEHRLPIYVKKPVCPRNDYAPLPRLASRKCRNICFGTSKNGQQVCSELMKAAFPGNPGKVPGVHCMKCRGPLNASWEAKAWKAFISMEG